MHVTEVLLALALVAVALVTVTRYADHRVENALAGEFRDDLVAVQEAVSEYQRQYPHETFGDWHQDWLLNFPKIARYLPVRFNRLSHEGDSIVVLDPTTMVSTGFGVSPYHSAYRLSTDNIDDRFAVNLGSDVTGLTRIQRVIRATEGMVVAVIPPPDRTLHDETTVFQVTFDVAPALKSIYYTHQQGQGVSFDRDVATGAISPAGMLSPLAWSDEQFAPPTAYPSGVEIGGVCDPEETFGGIKSNRSVAAITATGQTLFCMRAEEIRADPSDPLSPFVIERWRWRSGVSEPPVKPTCYDDRDPYLFNWSAPGDPPVIRVYYTEVLGIPPSVSTWGGVTTTGFCLVDHPADEWSVWYDTDIPINASECSQYGGAWFNLPAGLSGLPEVDRDHIDPHIPAQYRFGGADEAHIEENVGPPPFRCGCATGGELVLPRIDITDPICGINIEDVAIKEPLNPDGSGVTDSTECRDLYEVVHPRDVLPTDTVTGQCTAEPVVVESNWPICASGADPVLITYDDGLTVEPSCSNPPSGCPYGYTRSGWECSMDHEELVAQTPTVPPNLPGGGGVTPPPVDGTPLLILASVGSGAIDLKASLEVSGHTFFVPYAETLFICEDTGEMVDYVGGVGCPEASSTSTTATFIPKVYDPNSAWYGCWNSSIFTTPHLCVDSWEHRPYQYWLRDVHASTTTSPPTVSFHELLPNVAPYTLCSSGLDCTMPPSEVGSGFTAIGTSLHPTLLVYLPGNVTLSGAGLYESAAHCGQDQMPDLLTSSGSPETCSSPGLEMLKITDLGADGDGCPRGLDPDGGGICVPELHCPALPLTTNGRSALVADECEVPNIWSNQLQGYITYTPTPDCVGGVLYPDVDPALGWWCVVGGGTTPPPTPVQRNAYQAICQSYPIDDPSAPVTWLTSGGLLNIDWVRFAWCNNVTDVGDLPYPYNPPPPSDGSYQWEANLQPYNQTPTTPTPPTVVGDNPTDAPSTSEVDRFSLQPYNPPDLPLNPSDPYTIVEGLYMDDSGVRNITLIYDSMGCVDGEIDKERGYCILPSTATAPGSQVSARSGTYTNPEIE